MGRAGPGIAAIVYGKVQNPRSRARIRKDEWYAQCLYGDNDTDVTVIISGQVLAHLKRIGVSSFPVVVEAALEAAEEVDWDPKQVVVLMDSPLLQKMMVRFRRQ